MTRNSLKHRALPFTVAALATGSFIAASSHPALAASSTKKYTGSVQDQGRWGPIQVTISVKNKKITNVSANVSPDNPRSNFIESQALPMLKQEVLKTQNVNIDQVSGATDTSYGYMSSLQSAVKKAVKAKTLPSRDL